MNNKIREIAMLVIEAEKLVTEEFNKANAQKITERDWSNYRYARAAEDRLRDQLVAHVVWHVQFGKDSDES